MLNKQALLEWIARETYGFDDLQHDSTIAGAVVLRDSLLQALQSGRFDSPSDDRLWLALEEIEEWKRYYNKLLERKERLVETIKRGEEIHIAVLDESTTEPTGEQRVRGIHAEWVAERNKPHDPNYPIYGAIVENRIAQIEEIARALGINIPDKEDTNE